MRFLLLASTSREVEAQALRSQPWRTAADRFTGEMARAGVLLAADPLGPSASALSVRFPAGTGVALELGAVPTDDVVIGFWLVQARSVSEAVAWVRRWPSPGGDAVMEIREVLTPATSGRHGGR